MLKLHSLFNLCRNLQILQHASGRSNGRFSLLMILKLFRLECPNQKKDGQLPIHFLIDLYRSKIRCIFPHFLLEQLSDTSCIPTRASYKNESCRDDGWLKIFPNFTWADRKITVVVMLQK